MKNGEFTVGLVATMVLGALLVLVFCVHCGPTPYFQSVIDCKAAHHFDDRGENACIMCVRDRYHAGQSVEAAPCLDAGGYQ